MACNPTRQTCSPRAVFAANASPGCATFMDPGRFQAEQLIYDNAFNDLINNFGVPIDYYIHSFSLPAADIIYGEQPTAIFYGPITLKMYVELTENAIQLQKFGVASDDELTGYVHIQTFQDTIGTSEFYVQTADGSLMLVADAPTLSANQFRLSAIYTNSGQDIEPKSGDLITLTALGCDRPNGRGPKVFEVTERVDQDISALNPLLGHYVYRLRAKRFENSFEPGAPQENRNDQVFDNIFSGKVSSTIFGAVSSQPKVYTDTADSIYVDKVFDQPTNNTDMYGTY